MANCSHGVPFTENNGVQKKARTRINPPYIILTRKGKTMNKKFHLAATIENKNNKSLVSPVVTEITRVAACLKKDV